MRILQVAWLPRKAEAYERRNVVSFGEAQATFLDDNTLFVGDLEHSGDEERFPLLRVSARLRLIVV